jgi:hypothetical protein
MFQRHFYANQLLVTQLPVGKGGLLLFVIPLVAVIESCFHEPLNPSWALLGIKPSWELNKSNDKLFWKSECSESFSDLRKNSSVLNEVLPSVAKGYKFYLS